jgi:organic hydroperoxide reductase OsmC/OhrA
MAVYKDQRFTATADWPGGKRALVGGIDLPTIDVATPVEFGGEDGGVWSPEALLLAACVASYELTVVSAARARGVPLHAVEVTGAGHVTRRDDGRLGFIVIEIDARLSTDGDRIDELGLVAELAKDACIVLLALDVPIHVRVAVGALEPHEVTAG